MPDSQDSTEDGQHHQVKLHVPGILRLLSQHLYTDPKVALREMLQNAHDSCYRRLDEDPLAPLDYAPRIDVLVDAEQHTLSIRDNGAGLTAQEIHDYLSTVGRGYTAEIRERLAIGDPEAARRFIGQFGLGLLSAFIVADRVELVTRSWRPEEPAWLWYATGDDSYRLAPTERIDPGTTVTLHLKPSGEFLLNWAVLREAIKQYADFLHVPIYLNDDLERINVMDAPWHRGDSGAAYHAFVAERFDEPAPLAVIPLSDHIEEITLLDGTLDRIITPIEGVLYVPTASIVSLREYGNVSVYIRRMFITEDERDLLPPWAKFVNGVVDCPVLEPTVSRESVRHDETFYIVQGAIEQQVLAYFTYIAEHHPALWRNIVIAHNDLIKGWALQNHTFFESVCDLVTFDTSRGRLTLPEYLEVSGGDIYFFSEVHGSTQEKVLYEARGLVVINASAFAEEDFLRAYIEMKPHIELRQLEPGSGFVFRVDDSPGKHWEALLGYYTQQGIQARVAHFEPQSIPAIMIYPPGSDQIGQARQALENGDITGPIAKLVDDYLKRHDPDQQANRGTFHINADNLLIKRLLKLSPDDEVFTAAIEILYHNARFFAGRSLSPSEARQGFDMITFSVERLVTAISQTSDGDSRPSTD
ncbi:MAG: hypothetical protein GYB68_14990 [Chloroflexi bacterium]|nr:hypothetical protein [Chloroflexota bacterium]